MVEFAGTALQFLRTYGPIALLVFTFLETSMLFPFLPSEIVVPAAAAVIVDDPLSLLVFVGAATVGGVIGAFVPFYVFRGPGSRGIHRLRDAISVSDSTVERGRNWFRRWGRSSVLWGRFLPGLRSVVSVPAALTDMTPVRFGVYTAVGTVGFYAAVGALVYYTRRRSLFAAAWDIVDARPGLAAVTVVGVLVIGLLGWAWVRRRNAE